MEYEFGIVPTKTTSVEKYCKTVFSPAIARRLLKMGNILVDIKPNRDNPIKTIFVFEVSNKFNRDFANILSNTAK